MRSTVSVWTISERDFILKLQWPRWLNFIFHFSLAMKFQLGHWLLKTQSTTTWYSHLLSKRKSKRFRVYMQFYWLLLTAMMKICSKSFVRINSLIELWNIWMHIKSRIISMLTWATRIWRNSPEWPLFNKNYLKVWVLKDIIIWEQLIIRRGLPALTGL
jgi:hypothetical protein